MGNAATIAGLGFGNSNLGLAHAMGHSFGALFKQPHGRAVALYLPYTIDFTTNATLGRYADIARFIGLTDSRDEEEGGRILAEKVRELALAVSQPLSIAEFGIDRADFREMLPKLVEYAEQDTQFFTAPRIPESEELAQMFEYVYEGRPIDF
ncbi:MAG: iron-containing alcohol dehydrogenase, partial [Caldilineaceae bacterium]|nr:iron-containing alcohol dehydrogenase [Caldilineaceae bacterium]